MNGSSHLPLDGNNAFPDFIRNDADNFFAPFVTLPEEIPAIEFESAAELIVETVKNSPEPVAILSTGSLTNIAEALRIDPSIINNIEVLQIMGGRSLFLEIWEYCLRHLSPQTPLPSSTFGSIRLPPVKSLRRVRKV